ncbi:MAG: long-chain fatty acid--CoA ligase, partial [Verrucomicrobia bacterium]|nr:long-chain fatty acid--CoA ligase [Verrucomicrobiota bacterium]
MTSASSFANYSRRLLAFIERGTGAAESEFAVLARELFALQFMHVAPYRRLCEARGVGPDSVADWRQI